MKMARVLAGINVDGDAGEVDKDEDRADVDGVDDHCAFVNAFFYHNVTRDKKIGQCSREG